MKSFREYLAEAKVEEINEVKDNFFDLNKGREGKSVIKSSDGTENKDRIILSMQPDINVIKVFDKDDGTITTYRGDKEYKSMTLNKNELKILKQLI